MKLKMTAKILMMTGLLILIDQAQVKASESVVIMEVPVNISGLLGQHVRSAAVGCRIWTTFPKHYRDAVSGIQLVGGSFSGIAQVRLTPPSTKEQFKVGDKYVCSLLFNNKKHQGVQKFAKPGTRHVTSVQGTL